MTDNHTPRFTHDCDSCNFLGRFGDRDLYVHVGETRKSSPFQTVIARASSEGSDYESGMSFAFGLSEALTEARRRAEKADLIDYPFVEALRMLKPDDGTGLDELLTKGRQEPLLQFVLAMQADESTYEQFCALAQAFIDEQTQAFGEPTPHRYLGWFVDRVRNAVRLVYAAKADTMMLWVYAQEERFESSLPQLELS